MTGGADRARAPWRVLVVDDSVTIRALLRATLEADPRLRVVGEARDAFEAREKIRALSPDVITLDVEMPRMNGLEFLERLMRLRPTPVVMVSNRTTERSADAVRALSIGAVDCVDVARLQSDHGQKAKLVESLVCAASAQVQSRAGIRQTMRAPGIESQRDPFRWNGRMVLVGSSTGGVDAIERMLAPFPPDGPPCLIAQHMPEAFLRSFTQRLDDLISPNVRLAVAGDCPRQGEVLIAPGGATHLELSTGHMPRIVLEPATGHELHVPSVDRLFESAVPLAGRTLAVLLTGMGSDGASGMAALRHAGARTLAQTGETCVVDGMPRAARAADAVERSVPIDDLGRDILETCSARTAMTNG